MNILDNQVVLLSDGSRHIKEKSLCSELQKAAQDFVTNMKPDNIKNYSKIKNDYVECLKKNSFI